jgi:hypothetical protein
VAERIHAKAKGWLAAKGHGADVVVRHGMTGCALPDPAARLARATLLAKLIPAAPSDQVLGEAPALSPARPASAALPLAPRRPAGLSRRRSEPPRRRQHRLPLPWRPVT